ncbi:hypothetical protein [Pseudothauera rhizosphaerae]|uniref:Uncharacterized protein n=1 Tax=Pseudothauera rhizosphaerae TaxID=2565932 RepID=A0A4S4A7A4_9RHOO|nr:hypothetical protein [Pseudothauera rhizosphaerae]THF54592.1 hypothetical protein E6O51_21605 [Pseudothauera rhizosphaerae]
MKFNPSLYVNSSHPALKEFWWMMKGTFIASALLSAMAFISSKIGLTRSEIYLSFIGSVDDKFPGIGSIVFTSPDPLSWRLFFVLLWIVVPYFALRLAVAGLKSPRSDMAPLKLLVIVISASVFGGLVVWTMLFSEKPSVPMVVSRGSGLIYLLNYNYISLCVGGWIFMVFIVFWVGFLPKLFRDAFFGFVDFGGKK